MRRNTGVTLRAVLLGLAGVVALCAVTPYNNWKIGATLVGGNQFPTFAVFCLLLLALPLNAALRRFIPRVAFSPGELLTVWTMVLVSSGLAASGMMRVFIPNIAAPHFYSDERNGWEAKVWGLTPEWLKMHDADAAKAFFVGYPRGQEHIPWAAWAGPLFFWGLFAVFFLAASFCVAALFRRQWIEYEKFTFPLVTLPIQLAAEPEEGRSVNRLLRHPLLWVGVAVTTAVHTLKGGHLLYPTVPDLPISWNFGEMFVAPPWNQIDRFEATIYFLVIGISYLLSAEVCFSLWFFFLVYKAEIIICALYNWDMPKSLSGYSWKHFHSLQAFGGAVALALWTLWAARHHLRRVWQGFQERTTEPGELISYRALVLTLGISYAGMAAWEWAAGFPIPLILLSLVIVTLALVVIGWVVCQAGMLFMAMPYSTVDVLAPTLGTSAFPLSAQYNQYRAEGAFVYNTREMLLPSLLNGAKAGAATGTSPRRLFAAMVLAVAVGVVVSAVASLWLPYYNGGGNSMANAWTYRDGPTIPLRFYGGAASIPYPPAPTSFLHIGGGFFGVLLLLYGRGQFGWTLHPIGFLGASVHAVHCMWFSLFLGWAAKSLISRYGGMKGYVSAMPFFLGLVVGDVLNATLWTVLGILTGTGYNILPT
jgi:hypothetical protein